MQSNGRKSIIFASLATPATLLVSGVVSWLYKSSNPDNVDITAGLAYLRPILLSSFVTFGVFMLVALSFALKGKKRDQSPELSYLGLSLVVVLTLVSIAGAVAYSGAGDAEEAYRQQQAERFFENLQQ
jgi:hypothetical protein